MALPATRFFMLSRVVFFNFFRHKERTNNTKQQWNKK